MILDTNALSALAERDLHLIQSIQLAPRLCITLISLGEYYYGISQSKKPKELEGWLKAFLKYAEVLSPGTSTLPHYAAIRRELKKAGTPVPANDCWIAALVREHRMPLVSRDRHFDKIEGIPRRDW